MDTFSLAILNLITSQIEDFSISEIDLSFILSKLIEIQNSISSLSIQDVRRPPERFFIFQLL